MLPMWSLRSMLALTVLPLLFLSSHLSLWPSLRVMSLAEVWKFPPIVSVICGIDGVREPGLMHLM